MEAGRNLWIAQYYNLPGLLCYRDANRDGRHRIFGDCHEPGLYQFSVCFLFEETVDLAGYTFHYCMYDRCRCCCLAIICGGNGDYRWLVAPLVQYALLFTCSHLLFGKRVERTVAVRN